MSVARDVDGVPESITVGAVAGRQLLQGHRAPDTGAVQVGVGKAGTDC